MKDEKWMREFDAIRDKIWHALPDRYDPEMVCAALVNQIVDITVSGDGEAVAAKMAMLRHMVESMWQTIEKFRDARRKSTDATMRH